MFRSTHLRPPAIISELELTTKDTGFTLTSDSLMGSLLRTLVASKPAGSFLELGTGTGIGTAWMLDGIDATSRLITVDSNENVLTIAKRYLSNDPRVTFLIMDGAEFIQKCTQQQQHFDLIFADATPGKFTLLEETLALLEKGGLYIIDHLLFQPSWTREHAEQVDNLIASLEQRTDIRLTKLNWSMGLIIATKI